MGIKLRSGKVAQGKCAGIVTRSARKKGASLFVEKDFFKLSNQPNGVNLSKQGKKMVNQSLSGASAYFDFPRKQCSNITDRLDTFKKEKSSRRMTIEQFPIIWSGNKIAQSYKSNPRTIHVKAPSGKMVCCRKGRHSQGYVSTNRVNYPGVQPTFSRYKQGIDCLLKHADNDDSYMATLLLSYIKGVEGKKHKYCGSEELMRAADMLTVIALVAEPIRDPSAGALFIQVLSNIAKKREGYTWDTFFKKFAWSKSCGDGREQMSEFRNPGQTEIKHTPGKRLAAVDWADSIIQQDLPSRPLFQ